MRTKLAVVLLVPSLTLVAVAGVQVRILVNDATTLDDFAAQVRLGQQVAALVDELQFERDRTVGELSRFEASGRSGEPGDLSPALQGQRRTVDAAAETFRRAGVVVGGGPEWRTAYSNAVRRLENLAFVRAGVGTGSLPRRAAHNVYGRTIESLLLLLALPTPGNGHAALARVHAGNVELARTKELGSQLRARIYAVATADGFGPGDYVEIADVRAQRLATVVRFRSAAAASQVARYDAELSDGGPALAERLEQEVIDSAGRDGFALNAGVWWQASSEQLRLIRGVERELLTDAARLAARSSQQMWQQTWFVAGGIGAILLIALLISLVIGRSMARSLRSLRRDALEVAQVELPRVLHRLSDVRAGPTDISVRPPTVRSGDEIGEVADAFAAVHASAVSLALEQAAMRRNVNTMFVNLARRSQVLVERQIELLDELERDVGDPDMLDGLFKLDHLAARMRRNDENLLVLAGSDNTRQWNEPIALSAALLAAIAEIEQYPRVQHESDDTWYIAGHAVADVVHLLAELLENATAFSPPTTEVRIVGSVAGDHVLIEVSDSGIGMSPRAIELANALLERPPAADVAASERMGLFVVSHLAARHGVRVRLRRADEPVGNDGRLDGPWLDGVARHAGPMPDQANQGGRIAGDGSAADGSARDGSARDGTARDASAANGDAASGAAVTGASTGDASVGGTARAGASGGGASPAGASRLGGVGGGLVAAVWLPPSLLAPAPTGRGHLAPAPTATPDQREARQLPGDASVWWSRADAAPPGTAASASEPPAATEAGSGPAPPAGVRMAQTPDDGAPLPAEPGAADAAAGQQGAGGVQQNAGDEPLSRFYGGAHRARGEERS